MLHAARANELPFNVELSGDGKYASIAMEGTRSAEGFLLCRIAPRTWETSAYFDYEVDACIHSLMSSKPKFVIYSARKGIKV